MGPKNLANHEEPSDQEQHLVIGNVRDRLVSLCLERMAEGTNGYATDADTIQPHEVLGILGVRVTNDMIAAKPEPPVEREALPVEPQAPVEHGTASEGMSVVISMPDEPRRSGRPSGASKSQGSRTQRPSGGGSGY